MSTEFEGTASRAYRVLGRVQGVGFRWWTRHTAEGLGLGGTVRNLPDGSVEVHATGAESSLRALEDALREGPPASRVDGLEPIAPEADMPQAEFRILM